jgi:hypothetical protein
MNAARVRGAHPGRTSDGQEAGILPTTPVTK